ncbi:hypothetical protein FJTKL_06069 [Diaporthe vaccinii]|uniref:Transmembrane protein n=1 Tax=Diaporthe vaccinii TaxID=105482 RepID=A0ABR4EX80_9PEZI
MRWFTNFDADSMMMPPAARPRAVFKKKRRVYERELGRSALSFAVPVWDGRKTHRKKGKQKGKRLFHIIQKSRPAAKSVSSTPLSTPFVPFLHPPAARTKQMCERRWLCFFFCISRDRVDSRMQIFFCPSVLLFSAILVPGDDNVASIR